MIRFMYIPNMKTFVEALEKCCGSVLLHLPDHTTCDLTAAPAAGRLLKLLPSGCNNLCLSFSDPRDSSAFIKYMMEAAHD